MSMFNFVKIINKRSIKINPNTEYKDKNYEHND